jgi:hypothetical protein
MGVAAVVINLRKVLNNMALCKKDLLSFHPDVLILIDFPGFNLRMAEFAKKLASCRLLYFHLKYGHGKNPGSIRLNALWTECMLFSLRNLLLQGEGF